MGVLVKVETNVKMYIETTKCLVKLHIYFPESTKIFEQSIIRYINKPEYSVGLFLTLTICLALYILIFAKYIFALNVLDLQYTLSDWFQI